MTCYKSDFTHKHHIIPRYMGGPDTPENLVEVTVTQHAMFHFCNYQLWGNVEDFVAWRGLSGQISEEEFLKEKFKLFGQEGYSRYREKLENTPELAEEYERKRRETWNKNKDKNLIQLMEAQKLAVEAARTPENIEKKKQSFKEIGHQQGEKNSNYGKMWITDGTKEGSYTINKGDPIPEGFRRGRISKNEDDIKYIYVITTPQGEVIKTKYLIDFCERNNLLSTKMYAVSLGKASNHKGFKVHKEEIIT